MKLTTISLFCILSTSQVLSQHIDSNAVPPEISRKQLMHKPFPNFQLSNGKLTLTNESISGKVVYINFWFTECVPCMQEMPQINDLFEKFRNDTSFVLLSITYDDEEKIKLIKEKFHINYNIFPVTHFECLRLNPTYEYPANIIVDKNGIIDFYETGGAGLGFLITRYFRKTIYKRIEDLLSAR